MSQENVEALKAVYARWAEGDLWTPEIFHPDVEFVWAQEMPDAFSGRGIDKVETGARSMLAVWDDLVCIPERFVPVDDRVLVLFTLRGRGKGSNLEIDAQWAHLWTFADGKATRLEGFVDQDQALAAVGLD
jgi:ketosteroid isomerase-like protein